MATSSITKNFVLSGAAEAEAFVAAMEASAADLGTRQSRMPVQRVEDTATLKKILRKRKEARGAK
ncbi:MAG: hypothetical protein IJ631_06135 [Schwartzia sp.]|nr:hypothetical protein [Schwartzia sp. (in: firmicutes)]